MAAKGRILCTLSPASIENSAIYFSYDNKSKCFVYLFPPKSVVVIHGFQRKTTTTYPSTLRDVCMAVNSGVGSSADQESPQWWALCDDGIWKSTSCDEQISQNRDEPEPMDIDPDIFSDLLHHGDMTHTQGTTRCLGTLSTDCGSRVMAGVPGAHRLQILGNKLVLLIQKEHDDWLLNFYHIQTKNDKFLVDVQRSVTLGNLCAFSPGISSLRNCDLYVMIPATIRSTLPCPDHRTLIVSTHLFTYLCGTPSSLIDMPMCMVTSSSGVVYSVPLVSQSEPHTPEIIMDIGEPVIAIFTLTILLKLIQGEPKLTIQSVLPPLGDKSGNCLLVVGQNGKLHVVVSIVPTTAKKSESTCKVVSQVYVVPGPVKCADVHSNLLVHSTGRQVYVSDMTSVLQDLINDSPGHTNMYVPLKNQSQGVCNVIQIALETPHVTSKESLCEVPYVAVTCKGRMMRLTATVNQKTNSTGPPHHSPGGSRVHSPGGSRIKDVLTGIGRVSDLMTGLQEKLKRQNEILQQLHVASLIASLIASELPRSDSKLTDVPCLCNVVVNSHDSPVVVSWAIKFTEVRSAELSCDFVLRIVPNRICLGNGWYVSVSVSDHGSASGEITRTKLVELSQLSSGEFIDVHVNLDQAIYMAWKLPIAISTEFMYQFQCDNDNNQSFSDQNASSQCVYVPLQPITLDAYHFLRPVHAKSLQIPRQYSNPRAVLEKLAKDRPYKPLITNKSDSCEVKGQGSYTSSLVVTETQLRELKLKSASELLQWLFSETDIKTSGTTIRVTTLLNHQVAISIQSQGGSTSINMQTQQMALMCQLEHCLKRKLMILPEGDQPIVTTLQIRKALGQIQAIQEDVNQIRSNHSASDNTSETPGCTDIAGHLPINMSRYNQTLAYQYEQI